MVLEGYGLECDGILKNALLYPIVSRPLPVEGYQTLHFDP
jgi:hypothetical protein